MLNAWDGDSREHRVHTSTAFQMSFSVLHFKIPSATAPTISSTYFSRERDSMSFRIESRFSRPTDWRMRLIRAVCLLSEESRVFPISTIPDRCSQYMHRDGEICSIPCPVWLILSCFRATRFARRACSSSTLAGVASFGVGSILSD